MVSTVKTDVLETLAAGPSVLTGQSASRCIIHHDLGNQLTLNSLNVSSFTDDGTGIGTINFSNNFSDGFYIMAGFAGSDDPGVAGVHIVTRTNAQLDNSVSSVKISTVTSNAGGNVDVDIACLLVNGDLA